MKIQENYFYKLDNSKEVKVVWKKYDKANILEIGIEYPTAIVDLDRFSGIPSTEEWLIKLGFEKIIDNEFTLRYELKKDPRFDYFFPKHNLKTFGLRFQGSTFFDVVKYVHQLQNLYFALTGKELTYEN